MNGQKMKYLKIGKSKMIQIDIDNTSYCTPEWFHKWMKWNGVKKLTKWKIKRIKDRVSLHNIICHV